MMSPHHCRNNGVEYCDGLSALARAMIGLALCMYRPHHLPLPLLTRPELPTIGRRLASHRPAVLVLLAAIFTMYVYRRRRVRQSHLAYTQRGSASAYGPYGSPGGPPPFSPQYPPPAHNGLNSPYFYDPATGFAPVRHISVLTSDFLSCIRPFLDALTLAAFYGAAAVLSATTWRAPDQISEVKHRRRM